MSQGFHYLKSKVQGFLEGFNAKLVQFKRFVVEKTGKFLQILGKIFKYIVSKLIQMWNVVKTKFEMVFGSMNEVRFRLVQLKEFMELAMTCRLMLWFLVSTRRLSKSGRIWCASIGFWCSSVRTLGAAIRICCYFARFGWMVVVLCKQNNAWNC
ncbi:hypothetical protein ACLB2K_021640 [Fragaria x ananassa]